MRRHSPPIAAHRLVPVLSILLAMQPLSPAGIAAASAQAALELDEAIRNRVEAGSGLVAPVIIVAGERIHAGVELPRFYERRAFRPAWVTAAGPTQAADSLIRAIERADREGLTPADYHLSRIRSIHAAMRSARRETAPLDRASLADVDLLLTDAFLLYAAHLVAGRVDPVEIHPEWNAARREVDLVAVLDSALLSGRIGAALETLLPTHPGYFRLRDALQRYRGIVAEGGYPVVPGRVLRPGMDDPAVGVLRKRLRMSGDLRRLAGSAPHLENVYDEHLRVAVRRFQARHGLEPDGIAGLETNAVLNLTAEQRVRAIELNLERWRWLPRDLGQRHVLVNIAGFELEVVDGDSTIFASRVMVGQRYRKTPVFSDRMSYLVLNPTWTIPPNILEVDKLPLIRKDPGYLAAHRIRLIAPDGRPVDPATVDWSKVTGSTSYRFRMDPGPENPLGQVKFMFPNPYHVYLHDTPGRELFGRTERAFSSGCIRVERPLDLAALLLAGDSAWSRDRIDAALARGTEQTVSLRRPVPVHLLYWTAWSEADGRIQFRPDIYERDALLDEALRAPPPLAARGQGRPVGPG